MLRKTILLKESTGKKADPTTILKNAKAKSWAQQQLQFLWKGRLPRTSGDDRMFSRLTAKKNFQHLRRRFWKIWGIQELTEEVILRLLLFSIQSYLTNTTSVKLWASGSCQRFLCGCCGRFVLIRCVILWHLAACASFRDPLPQVKLLKYSLSVTM